MTVHWLAAIVTSPLNTRYDGWMYSQSLTPEKVDLVVFLR